jgi:hypothetical protein
MAVQYSPLPEFQAPNVNILGAYAQGAALRRNQLEEEKLAQVTELAGLKYKQEAEAAQRKAQADELDFAVKNADIFKSRVQQLNPADPSSQYKYNELLREFQPKAPSILGGLPTQFSADTQRALLMQHDDFMKTVTPHERETQVDGRGGKAMFIFDPYTQAERMVSGSFQAAPEKWSPVRGEKQQIEYYTNQTGTEILTPDEYKERMRSKTTRGQAGEIAPAAAPMAAPTGDATMDLVNRAKGGVANVESGSPQGNYGAIGPEVKRKSGVDHAYGKYQVMGANIPSWTKQALGKSMTPDEFLASPEAQEKVFEDQFTRNVKKYGNLEDAVSVWFSGRPLAQATKAGARDVNMGVGDYVGKVMGGIGPYKTAATVPLTGEQPSLRGLPVNAMAPMAEPVNAMAAPVAPVAAPTFGAAPTPQPTPMQPPAPVQDTAARQQQFIANAPLGQSNKYKSKVELENMLTNFGNEIEYLAEQGGVPSVKYPAAKNAEISTGASWLGQAYGRFTGSPIQSTRDTVDSIRQYLVSVLARATGKTAQELNSNFDVKNAIKALGDPKATVESVRATLNNLNKSFGTNVDISGSSAKSESRRQIEAAKAAPPEAAGIPPAAIEELRANPGTAALFDQHFGVPGLAAKILGR